MPHIPSQLRDRQEPEDSMSANFPPQDIVGELLTDPDITLLGEDVALAKLNRTPNRNTNDLVRLYLQEIGRVRLLQQHEEVSESQNVQQYMELLELRSQSQQQGNELIVEFVRLITVHDRLAAQLGHRPSWERWAKVAEKDLFTLKQSLNQGKEQWAKLADLSLLELETRISGGLRSKSRMIRANLRLVVSVAKKYQSRGMELLDLIQEGTLGLERGVEKFDPSRGYKFSTYAYWWIRQAITRAIAQQSRAIRLPIHITEKLNKIKKAQRELSQKLGRNATQSEIAQALNLEPAQIREYLVMARQPVSLDIKVGDNQDTELLDLLEDEGANPLIFVTSESLRDDLANLMAELTPQQQQVITLRFGLEDGNELSLAKVGDKLNISRERVRQLEHQALNHLRRQHRQVQEYIAS